MIILIPSSLQLLIFIYVVSITSDAFTNAAFILRTNQCGNIIREPKYSRFSFRIAERNKRDASNNQLSIENNKTLEEYSTNSLHNLKIQRNNSDFHVKPLMVNDGMHAHSQDMKDDYIVLAKKEEPGDRESIIRMIKEYQVSISKGDNPTFPFETILERTLDTIEDIFVHVRRIPYDYGWIKEDELNKVKRETVVILGSGWAAHAYLKIADTFRQRIIVVSPSNHFVFTPMLASASVGTVEYRSMTEAVRAANPMIENYIEGTATNINVNEKTITVELKSILEVASERNLDIQPKKPTPLSISYDRLIVAVGCQVADSMTPGAKKYALRLKSCEDARQLRTAIGESFEYASRPDVKDHDKESSVESERSLSRQQERRRRVTFCIVGGGPTGVELAGELADFVKDICKPRVGAYPDLTDYVKIVLVHGGPVLVPQFDVDLTQSAFKALTKEGVEVRLNTRVDEVGDGFIKLLSKDTGIEEIMPCGICVWAAGTEPVPFVTSLLDQLPETAKGIGGKIVVDQWLRCPMKSQKLVGSILIMGDAAAFQDPDNRIIESYLPQTAQVAGQQGAFVARLLDREYDLTQTPPMLQTKNINMKSWLNLRGLERADGFKFLNLGLLAYVGGGQALTQVQIGNVPIASYAGSTAFVLWRSVYLVKQVATRNRVLVTFDWIKSAIFGRDITRL